MAAPMRSFAQAAATEETVVPLRVVQVDGLVRGLIFFLMKLQMWYRGCYKLQIEIMHIMDMGTWFRIAIALTLLCVQVALKIIKHCKECMPALVTGQLLGLDIGSILEVTNCFPFPVCCPCTELYLLSVWALLTSNYFLLLNQSSSFHIFRSLLFFERHIPRPHYFNTHSKETRESVVGGSFVLSVEIPRSIASDG